MAYDKIKNVSMLSLCLILNCFTEAIKMSAAHKNSETPQKRQRLICQYQRQIGDIDRQLYRAAFAGAFTAKGCKPRISLSPRHHVCGNPKKVIDERNHLAELTNQVAEMYSIPLTDVATYDKSKDEIYRMFHNHQ